MVKKMNIIVNVGSQGFQQNELKSEIGRLKRFVLENHPRVRTSYTLQSLEKDEERGYRK